MERPIRSRNPHRLVALCALCALCAPPRALRAEEKAPLRMSLLDVSERGAGRGPRDLLEAVLSENPQIELVDEAGLAASMDDFGINDKILRRGALRERFHARIGRLMRSYSVEGLLLIDVYGRNDSKLQIVIIGPEGLELDDIVKKISAGALERPLAVKTLREVFPTLGPRVLAYRRLAGAPAPSAPPIEEAPAPVAPSVDARIEAPEAIEEESAEAPSELGGAELGDKGEIATGPVLRLGPLFGTRSVLVEESNTNNPKRITHQAPLIGAHLGADWTALRIGSSGALALSGVLEWAPIVTRFDKQETTYGGSYLSFHAELAYLLSLTSSVTLELYAGGGNFNVLVDAVAQDGVTQNQNYTGNSYIFVRAGAGVRYALSDEFGIRLWGGTNPVVRAETSGGSLGPSPLSFGFHAGARAELALAGGFSLFARYAYERFAPTYPDVDPAVSVKLDSEASSTDQLHAGAVGVAYSFR